MKNFRLLALVVFCLIFSQQAKSQFGLTHEVGIITGPVAFYSDFGQRNDFRTNLNNTGIGIGLVHYLNLAYDASCNCYSAGTYFNDHFKIRNEIIYHQTNLEHYGEWVSPDKTSLFADQLRAMTSTAKVFEIGSQLEYFPWSIRDFTDGGNKLAPFISLGAHYVNFYPEVRSSLGRLNTPFTTPEKYYNGIRNEIGSTLALVGSVGVRYKLTKMSDLMLDSRWQYYFSDWVDGLNPQEAPENKSNDWVYWLNVGYIYYIN